MSNVGGERATMSGFSFGSYKKSPLMDLFLGHLTEKKIATF